MMPFSMRSFANASAIASHIRVVRTYLESLAGFITILSSDRFTEGGRLEDTRWCSATAR